MKHFPVWALVVLICAFYSAPAMACRYNVRDVGFVDLGNKPYVLFLFVNADTSEEIVSAFNEIPPTLLTDSNIKPLVLDVDQESSHPGLELFRTLDDPTTPSAVLVSPDGQTTPSLAITRPGQSIQESLQFTLNEIVSSIRREDMLTSLIDVYGGILVIGGADAQQTESIKEMAQNAIDAIASRMSLLPKAIGKPPILLDLPRNVFEEEMLLLWSLGYDPEKTDEPGTMVLYGRARFMGPLMVGSEITERRLTNLLSVIGADCECGLDRAVMQGTMIPQNWTQKLRGLAARNLQFDPESPMVKMEMSRILGRGRNFGGNIADTNFLPGGLAGYQELEVTFETIETPATKPEPLPEPSPAASPTQTPPVPSPAAAATTPTLAAVEQAPDDPLLAQSESPFNIILAILGGVAVIVVAGGIGIVLRSRKA